MNRRAFLGMMGAGAATLWARDLFAQIERRSEIYPLAGPYRFALRRHFPTVYRYLNVVDIGHAELAEVLLTTKDEDRAVHRIEHGVWDEVKAMFLDPRKAPRLEPAGETVAPESAKVAWRLSKAFDWTHVLHRQIYDIQATDYPPERKDKYVRAAYIWYRSEPGRAFPGKLKSHDLMEHQWFSQYWREKYPRFNGAIWAYHWYQWRLNEVMLNPDRAAQRAAVDEATSEFRAMFENPELLPRHMPMAHEVAPWFLARYPEIALAFDNLHSFHDIYNDILAHPKIADKQAEVYKQLDVFLEPTKALETAPMHPLPADLSREDLRRLNQLDHLEHMATMVMGSAVDEMAFLHASPEQRAATLEKLMPAMAQTWPNFERKHASMGMKMPGHTHH